AQFPIRAVRRPRQESAARGRDGWRGAHTSFRSGHGVVGHRPACLTRGGWPVRRQRKPDEEGGAEALPAIRRRKDAVMGRTGSHKVTRPSQVVPGQPGPAPVAEQPGAHKWWTLAAVCLGMFMLLLDITVVNVALPAIQRDLGSTFADLQWVV